MRCIAAATRIGSRGEKYASQPVPGLRAYTIFQASIHHNRVIVSSLWAVRFCSIGSTRDGRAYKQQQRGMMIPTPATKQDSSVAQTEDTLGRRVASNAAWMILGRITIRLVGFAGTLAVVRLLSPDDFGIVAMAGMVGGTLENLSAFSFDLALVQAQGANRTRSDTVWTLNVARGAVISLFTACAAPLMATIMAEPRIEHVMYVLALAPLLQGFENIALINWQRDLRFDNIFRLTAYSKIVGLCMVVPTALIFGNYWALVITQVSTAVVVVPLGYYLYPYYPRFTIHDWKPLFHFSKWLFANNLLTVVENFSGGVLISRLFGSAVLGLCQISSEIGHLPGSEIAAPIRRPMYAGYAQVADDYEELRNQVVAGFGIVVMLMLPVTTGMAATADIASRLLLGPKWIGSAPLIVIYLLTAFFENLRFFMQNVYVIKHAQKQYAVIFGIMQILRIILFVGLGLTYGLIAGLWGVFVIVVLNVIICWGVLLNLLQMRWSGFIGVSWRTVAAALTMVASLCAIGEIWPDIEDPAVLALELGTQCLAGLVIQVGVQLCLWAACGRGTGPERNAIEWSKDVFQRLRHRATGFVSGGGVKTNPVEL